MLAYFDGVMVVYEPQPVSSFTFNHGCVAQWLSGRSLDLRSVGRGFDSHWSKAA